MSDVKCGDVGSGGPGLLSQEIASTRGLSLANDPHSCILSYLSLANKPDNLLDPLVLERISINVKIRRKLRQRLTPTDVLAVLLDSVSCV